MAMARLTAPGTEQGHFAALAVTQHAYITLTSVRTKFRIPNHIMISVSAICNKEITTNQWHYYH